MRRVLGLFPSRSMPPRPQRLPAAELSAEWRTAPPGERRGPSRDEAARADIALRLLGTVRPSDRALEGRGGWLGSEEEGA